ncbi:hypothetical protein A6395_00330 [Exiguobacterium sp. SH31]|uniref:hypothetical protein n=1 Tax=Exiguobacterium sp. SH31 TaxID=1843183 RepID=UPI0008CFBB62|nr:hypothetical protein [Exiguobacterium sp. SH31]OGX80621.1 hypothetical protein A6395_00330 [Exiguobacterium sp. SH31]
MWHGECNGLELDVRHLTDMDLTAIEAVQQTVIADLAEGSHYQALTTDEFMKLLSDQTIIGAFHKDALIAFRALLIPPLDDEHLGRDIGRREDELDRIIYQEVTNVDPSYRGYRLQQHLGKLLMEELSQDERFDLVCATVAPFNIPSLKDKFVLGLRIGALKQKYGGKLRYIFMKELHAGWRPLGETAWLEMSDTDGQVELLKTGWYGTAMKRVDETWLIQYER